MIGIINYGMGNVGSIKNMLKKIGEESEICDKQDELNNFTKLVLPGVGAFDNAMSKLNQSGFTDAIKHFATTGKPVLGICLGMQLLANNSEEGSLAGLGLIPGEVKRFNLSSEYKIPHMGWNSVVESQANPLLQGLEANKFYFVHSYHFVPHDQLESVGETDYGYSFTSMVRKDNVFGAQFHPEKSHRYGMQLFRNFAAL